MYPIVEQAASLFLLLQAASLHYLRATNVTPMTARNIPTK